MGANADFPNNPKGMLSKFFKEPFVYGVLFFLN
jgi:hypothetical protein